MYSATSSLNFRFVIKFLSAAASRDGSQQKRLCYWSPQLPNPITLLVIQKRELQKTHTHAHTRASEASTNMMFRLQMNQASISSRGQKMLHNSNPNIFLVAWFNPTQRVSLALHLLHPSSALNFIWGMSSCLCSPLPHMLSTLLRLLPLWISCAAAFWFSCLTNMDSRPKWLLKSSNGLWRAGWQHTLPPSLSLPVSLTVCVCLYTCLFTFMCVCAHLRALPGSLAGRWQRWAEWQPGNEIRMSDS